MDLKRFFLVSFHLLVGVTIVVLIDPCDDSFLSSYGRGSLSSEYIHTTAATCDMFWPNKTWNFRNTFVGLNTTQSCPAMKHCSNLYSLWMMGTLPVSNDIVPKLFCETEATGCCKNVNNTTIKVRKCSLLRVYFHRNSTGCDKAFCFERPDVDHAPMRNSSVATVSPINIGNETNASGQTSSDHIPDWSICPIAMLIAAIMYLIILVIVFLKQRVNRKIHVVDDKAEKIIQARKNRIAK
ncbi:uncharacterized protein LOC128156763 [Crassostrea angulata]|uniref:uncharacterized protein LOC128156763 n=1 Tax=Magallana angulata TaxID=2784310 RepID=UPI0022B1B347|nr:uncharacterized protein LOC128156763 [Crassostrea angulata]